MTLSKYDNCSVKAKCNYRGANKLITAKKILLNYGFIEPTETTNNENRYDVTTTYELVIFNNSKYTVTNLSIVDSLLGLHINDFDKGSGELRPYFTNVQVYCRDDTIHPLTFEQIAKQGGELVHINSCISPKSTCSIIIRITGRGFLLPRSPFDNVQLPIETQVDKKQNCLFFIL